MANVKRYEIKKLGTSALEVRLSNCKWFEFFLEKEFLSRTNYIYRGHANASWLLEPTLDRIVGKPGSPKRAQHLRSFQYATRGRRGSTPLTITNENDWWALGQHHGLATPLLDWSESPFVALYFASSSAFANKTRRMAVWALSKHTVEKTNKEIKKDASIEKINGRVPTVNLFSPMSDENPRLVSQRGLFTRGPNNMDLATWMNKFHNENKYGLVKISMPTTGIEDRLKTLNRMNINYASLFPDLEGASRHCNMELGITSY